LHIRNGEGHLPLLGFWSRRWICHRVCDTRPVQCQTYWHLPSLAALSCAQKHKRPICLVLIQLHVSWV